MALRKLILFACLGLIASAELSGRHLGPLTTVRQKSCVKSCNILNYGAKDDNQTDIGPAIAKAFSDCKDGGVVHVPEGNFALSTFQTLAGGQAWAFRHDGIITRATNCSGPRGTMIVIKSTTDFEYYSANGKGAFQGLGYHYHQENDWEGPRLLRFEDVKSFSVHDIAFTDPPSFHFACLNCTDGKIFRLAMRAAYHGQTDGLDLAGNNVWVYNITVTNKDECITVKSPSQNVLIENIHCNWSGGSAIGSLTSTTSIQDITFRNIYTRGGNQMMMIKSNGGKGFVRNVLFENFIGHGSSYGLDIDQEWKKIAAGTGVKLSELTFRNWQGTVKSGTDRPPIKIICDDDTPCTGIQIIDFNVCGDDDDLLEYTCQSAYGFGPCLKSLAGEGVADSYPLQTQNTSCTRRAVTPILDTDLPGPIYGTQDYIPIPEIPDEYFPWIPDVDGDGDGPGSNGRAGFSTGAAFGGVSGVGSGTGSGTAGQGRVQDEKSCHVHETV